MIVWHTVFRGGELKWASTLSLWLYNFVVLIFAPKFLLTFLSFSQRSPIKNLPAQFFTESATTWAVFEGNRVSCRFGLSKIKLIFCNFCFLWSSQISLFWHCCTFIASIYNINPGLTFVELGGFTWFLKSMFIFNLKIQVM